MNATQQSLNNYFQSAQNFMNAWIESLKASNPEMANSPEAQKAFSDYEKWMSAFSKQAETYVSSEIGRLSSMSPDEIQQQSLSSITSFENAYKTASDTVISALDKEKAYISSDQFKTDIQSNRETATNAYNASLNTVSKMFDTFADTLKTM